MASERKTIDWTPDQIAEGRMGVSDNMIERVALAIAKVIGGKMGNEMSDWITPARLEEARAAIEAMREPTERMLVEGYGYSDLGVCDETHDWKAEMRIAWQAMIDAVLQEKPERARALLAGRAG